MYLPDTLDHAEVMITVKTYPLPSNKYGELVCTAGLLINRDDEHNGKWVRIYPVVFRQLPYDQQYRKYECLRLNLDRNMNDFRPESYRPRLGIDEPLEHVGSIGTGNNWARRKAWVEREVFTSMDDLLAQAKGLDRKSLAVVKPREIIDFVIEPEKERDWKPKWKEKLLQANLFEQRKGNVIRKLPYKYSYRFLTEGDKNPHTVMIEDWELGALYWNCLQRAGGDEKQANELVKQKYFDQFCSQNDISLFMGTTKQWHNVSPQPFIIIGVFYPLKSDEPRQTGFML